MGFFFHGLNRFSCYDLRKTDILKNCQPVQEHKILKDKSKLLVPHFCQLLLPQPGKVFSI